MPEDNKNTANTKDHHKHLDEKYPERRYPYEELRTNGLNTVQGPSRVTIELGQYLQDV